MFSYITEQRQQKKYDVSMCVCVCVCVWAGTSHITNLTLAISKSIQTKFQELFGTTAVQWQKKSSQAVMAVTTIPGKQLSLEESPASQHTTI